ncbi:thioredoxin H1-like [Hibiscus syriacus]|uniref:thioredoxin H1-like n=1 Tax=Hibiscus syriacus TaxID=106335 RepID=UPI001923CBAE|nr:thioredoxin H1-like [Hibiscus syriacus]
MKPDSNPTSNRQSLGFSMSHHNQSAFLTRIAVRTSTWELSLISIYILLITSNPILHTVETWEQQLASANTTRTLVVVDLTASWCGSCRFIAPVLADLAKKLPQVLFLKVDVAELKSVAQDWAIEAMLTFIFLKGGSIVDKVVGARKDELQQKIEKHVAAPEQNV